jgi:hypothetical protein
MLKQAPEKGGHKDRCHENVVAKTTLLQINQGRVSKLLCNGNEGLKFTKEYWQCLNVRLVAGKICP